jgi:tetratricopeptide (TPR) repeat protein
MTNTVAAFRLGTTLTRIAAALAAHINDATKQEILGETLAPIAKSGSGKALLKVAIFADGLRTVYDAMFADGEVDQDEVDLCAPFIVNLARLFAKTKSAYSKFAECSQEDCVAFLEQYASDTSIFGYLHTASKWSSLSCCARADLVAPEEKFRARLVSALLSATESLLKIGGVTPEEERHLLSLQNTILTSGHNSKSAQQQHHPDTPAGAYTPSTSLAAKYSNTIPELSAAWAKTFQYMPDVSGAELAAVGASNLFSDSIVFIFSGIDETIRNCQYHHACVVVRKNNVRLPIVCVTEEFSSHDKHFLGSFDICGHTTWRELEFEFAVDGFVTSAIQLLSELGASCRTESEVIAASKMTEEEFDTRYNAYEMSLKMFGAPEGPGWNDNIVKESRESQALTESEIFRAKTEFSQAVLNRVIVRWVSDGNLEPISAQPRPISEINTSSNEAIYFEYNTTGPSECRASEVPEPSEDIIPDNPHLSRLFLEKAHAAIDAERHEAAVENLEAAVMTDWNGSEPTRTGVWTLRAETLAALGNGDAQRAIAAYNSGHKLCVANKSEDDILKGLANFISAYQADPFFLWAINNAAWLAATNDLDDYFEHTMGKSRADFAVQCAQIACIGSEWRSWPFIDTLAEAYASAGEPEAAMKCWHNALQLAPIGEHKQIQRRIAEMKVVAKPVSVAETWHVSLNGQQSPALQLAQVQQYIQGGQVNASTMVWKTGMANWTAAGQTPELAPLLASPPGPSVAGGE